MSSRVRWARLLPVCALFLGACAVGPDYEVPVVPVPDAWHSAVQDEVAADDPGIVRWWESLDDPVLTDLVRRAELNNLDLRIGVSRIAESSAQRGIAKGDYYPNLVLDGAYSYTKISENSPTGQVITGTGGEIDPADRWEYRGATFWELDLWGRVRRGVESATASFEASIEDYRDLRVSLYAEVASNYVDVRALQTRLDFARENVGRQRESLSLTRDRFDAGLTSALDVAQAEQNLAQTESTIPSLESQLESALNRLAVVLGETPGALHGELEARLGIPEPSERPAAGVPANIVRRRPDIRRAERQLAAQVAQIGVAKADLYPTFSITGFLEGVSGSASNLFTGQSTGWGIVPGFRWDLFQGGKIRNNVRVQQARTQQLLDQYQLTVLRGLQEVETAIVAYDREIERRERLREAVTASERAVELVRTQYLSGLTNFQNLLDSQRSLFQQQDLLAQSEGQVVLNLVFLNRALGGGWTVDDPVPTELAAEKPAPDEATGGEE